MVSTLQRNSADIYTEIEILSPAGNDIAITNTSFKPHMDVPWPTITAARCRNRLATLSLPREGAAYAATPGDSRHGDVESRQVVPGKQHLSRSGDDHRHLV